jgi:hypothetical protein
MPLVVYCLGVSIGERIALRLADCLLLIAYCLLLIIESRTFKEPNED